MVHLVYCDNTGKRGEKTLDKILAGRKTMAVRSAAGCKIPHSRVFVGERLYFMEKGSTKVSAEAPVESVQNYVKLSEDEISKTFADNAERLALTDKQLERWYKKCIPTDFGETLDYDYYMWVKSHPITEWNSPTAILYAGYDNITDRTTVDDFTHRFGCTLTVMDDGEHWFHTPAQLAVLSAWEGDTVSFLKSTSEIFITGKAHRVLHNMSEKRTLAERPQPH